MKTPVHIIKTRVDRLPAYPLRFGHQGCVNGPRYGCRASVVLPDRVLAKREFYGDHGSTVRAEACAWAHAEAERHAQALQTRWMNTYESKRSPWEGMY